MQRYIENESNVTQKDVDFARNYAPGYIGGREVAQKATDRQVKQLIVLNDQKAKLFNRSRELEKRRGNIVKSIKS